MTIDRRENDRIVLDRPIRLRATNGSMIGARLLDMSLLGMGVLVPPCSESRYAALLRLPRFDGLPNEEVALHCRLIHSVPMTGESLHRVGMRFEVIQADGMNLIGEYLSYIRDGDRFGLR